MITCLPRELRERLKSLQLTTHRRGTAGEAVQPEEPGSLPGRSGQAWWPAAGSAEQMCCNQGPRPAEDGRKRHRRPAWLVEESGAPPLLSFCGGSTVNVEWARESDLVPVCGALANIVREPF